MNDEFNILNTYYYFKKRWKLLLIVPACISFLVFIYAICQPKIYRAQVSIMPLGSENNDLAFLLSNFTGNGSKGGSQQQIILNLIQSRTFVERVQKRFDLSVDTAKKLPVLLKTGKREAHRGDPSVVKGQNEMSWHLSVSYDANGLLLVAIDAPDATFAAVLANGVVDELQQYINEGTFTNAKRYRQYIGDQLMETRKQFLEASKGLTNFYAKNKISVSDSRLSVDVNLINVSNAVLANPNDQQDFEMISREIGRLEKEKKALEERLKNNVVHDISEQVYLEYMNASRSISGELNQLLSKQYEMAKIAEERKNLAFQIIDPARKPFEPFKPRIKRMVVLSFFASLMMTVFFIVILRYIRWLKELHGRD